MVEKSIEVLKENKTAVITGAAVAGVSIVVATASHLHRKHVAKKREKQALQSIGFILGCLCDGDKQETEKTEETTE